MLPQVLFVLMPVFALLVKICYLFQRRLDMEHLIVALHSHAFLFLDSILLTLCSLASRAVPAEMPWLATLLGGLIALLSCWPPIYLFLIQKRVYRQGWLLTAFKYGVIGISYSILVSLGAAVAFLVSLGTT